MINNINDLIKKTLTNFQNISEPAPPLKCSSVEPSPLKPTLSHKAHYVPSPFYPILNNINHFNKFLMLLSRKLCLHKLHRSMCVLNLTIRRISLQHQLIERNIFSNLFWALLDTFKFSMVFNEQPFIPTYKSNLRILSSSSCGPVNECTTPPENLDLLASINSKKSFPVLRLWRYIGSLYFSAKSKCGGKTSN